MNQVLSGRSSADAGPVGADNEELRVDFFRKLGYSSPEVKAAFRKLGPTTDTNSVLGELVRTRTSAAASVSSADGNERSAANQKDSLLPPSWALGPSRPTPPADRNPEAELRPIVIDGSNVAMSHGNKEVFSCRGIQLAVNFFLDRGHNSITVFVPTWRKEQPRPDAPLTDQHFLLELERQKIVVFTPSRRVGGKRVVCYDDRFIVKLAHESDGIIVSNDTYRDLQGERPEWKKCIEERLLMFSFVNDKFMPPDDPLGRHGPSLDNFLRKNPPPEEQKRQLCPYDKKCTYGIKCKFYHPERANQSYQSLADELREKAQISNAKEEKNAQLSSRQLQPDRSVCSHPQDSHPDLLRDQQGFPHPGQVTENKVLYWEDPRNSPNHVPCSVTGSQHQKEWPGLHLMANNYYANMSQEYLDSGLGSFESQFSDISHCSSHMLRHQHPSVRSGPNRSSMQNSSQSGSPSAGQASHYHHHQGNIGSNSLPTYDTYPSHMFPPSGPNRHSLPGHSHYNGAPQLQQSYWSDPFQGLPQSRPNSSLPGSAHSSNSLCSSYQSHQYNSWGQQHQQPPPQQPQPLPSPAFDTKRLELRKKLHAIFNPQQVDTVMEMFPHLMNAEKLAAEILKLKAQQGIF